MDTHSTALATTHGQPIGAIEQVLISGNLKALTPEQRIAYYHKTCESLGLNPLTRPFEYLDLQGKLTLYARKDCTEQLRNTRKISIAIVSREVTEGIYVVTAKAFDASGRCDESIGGVAIDNVKGEARANALMKAETKAKRRVTLSFCGLGMLDETEVETIPGATKAVDAEVIPPGQADGQQPPEGKPDQEGDEVKRQKAALDKLVALLKTKGVSGKDVLPWLSLKAKRDIKKLSEITPGEYQDAMDAATALPVPQPKGAK